MSATLNVLLPGYDKLRFLDVFAQWVARGTERPAAPPGYLHALAEHFRWPAGPLPVAALIRQSVAGDAGDALWVCADPAWVQPELSGARLLACGNLAVSAADAASMVDALGETFAEEGMALFVGDPQHWQLKVPSYVQVPAFPEPEEALGADLFEQLPKGDDGRRWRALINEAQVVLHNHPANADRQYNGLPPVNSIWLWGAGALPDWVECGQSHIYSDDLLVWALGQKSGTDVQGRSALVGARPARDPRPPQTPSPTNTPSTVTLLDLQDIQPGDFAQTWWPFLEARLEAGSELCLSFADGRRTVVHKRHRLRFWRKAKT
ncbi:hypothetical protein KPL74_03085 [Bacillus sp. NP157]|nr:hypothetical protein KPL74_03085 [Bacillus sp. NP157]